ncbi:hypothetical protein NM688_g5068 [Phlebia brevispora]|uniref:Uncharacterized protein n=1 Tax=Phlebia brevispora TaxID=194682 RepID=A0ACC1T146_9APHY|nr:hypothetical protein NM688_g5068 [Phlebia brevispora]
MSHLTLKTPQILELSGIGRKDVLDRIGVPVKIELPGVGENVQEHLLVDVSFVPASLAELKEDAKYETLDALHDPTVRERNLELYNTTKTGLFTHGIVNFLFAPLSTISPRAQEIYERAKGIVVDLEGKVEQLTSPEDSAEKSLATGLLEQYKILLERLRPGSGKGPGCEVVVIPCFLGGPNPPEPGKRYITFTVINNHVWSRGTIHCTSKDPLVDPEIDARYFDQDIDLDVYVEAVKFARALSKLTPMKDMIVGEHNPGPKATTDEQIKEWIKLTLDTVYHTAGSAAMLPRDKGGVVDNTLKVYGTSNLRVVDLSVVPLHVAAHTQGRPFLSLHCASVYAIAEQAAAIIKGEFTPM